jgi:hypothetical protein
MRTLFLLPTLIALIIVAGCASTVPSLPGSQQTLNLNQQANFENNDYAFTAAINHIEIKNNQTIIVTLTIENTGQKPMTLSAISSLNDPIGQSYVGQTVFFSQIAPGHKVTQTGTISLPGGVINQLVKGSTLKYRFQGTSPVPYETAWSIDLTDLPS